MSSRQGLHIRITTKPMLAVTLLLTFAGCVERTVTINTEPQGATVFLNDQEVGKSPAKVPFTWYGDYDIIIRKPGYQTLQTNKKIKAPWYQFPVIDLFAECLVPFTIYDERDLGTYALEPISPVPQDELLRNAGELKDRALISDSTGKRS